MAHSELLLSESAIPMQRTDFLKLIGAERETSDYLPVACLLRNGYGCAGHFLRTLNDDNSESCVLVNARLVDLRESAAPGHRGMIQGFTDFLEELVTAHYEAEDSFAQNLFDDDNRYGKSIPLMAVGYDEVSVLYPVVHIHTLMQRAVEDKQSIPSFLDFNRKSVIVKLLRTKLW